MDKAGRAKCFWGLLKSSGKLRTNLCGSFILLFSEFKNMFPFLQLDNNFLVSLFIACCAKDL